MHVPEDTLGHGAWFTEKAADPVLTHGLTFGASGQVCSQEGKVREDGQPHLWFKKRCTYTETAISGYEIIKRGFTHHAVWPGFPWRSGHAVLVDLIEGRADMQIKGQTPVPFDPGIALPTFHPVCPKGICRWLRAQGAARGGAGAGQWT